MGSWFSKEWEVVNEVSSAEQPAGTPPITERFHVLRDDPRSPTGEIARTPIEIEDTPKGTKREKENGEGNLGQSPLTTHSRKKVPESLHKKILKRHPLAPNKALTNKGIQNDVPAPKTDGLPENSSQLCST